MRGADEGAEISRCEDIAASPHERDGSAARLSEVVEAFVEGIPAKEPCVAGWIPRGLGSMREFEHDNPRLAPRMALQVRA